ncbi:MAG: WD40 repeat domain-containing serine/threonine protein kinase [Phycisphaerales bacterium]
MTRPAGTCPSPAALDAFAAGACADEAVAAHVERCETCRAVVEETRGNNLLLADVRAALAAKIATQAPSPERGSRTNKPDLVPGYELQEEIHRGGQGVVYRAIQTRTRRTVAIKMLLNWRGTTTRQKERFEREIRIAAALRHPNIVTVYDSGAIGDGQFGLVMEHIEGVTLDRWSRGLDAARGRDARRNALRSRLAVMSKVCDAVLCAHQHSIVHRDLKPANILVDAAGEPHVLDFGIARDLGPEERTRLTHTGEFAGTLAYSAPEQVSGDPSKVDTRTDIYSLGVILYELVGGRMPYSVDGSMARTIQAVESDEPAPLNRRSSDPDGPWVDGDVSTIVLKALSKDPVRRYQTAAGLRDDIDRYLAGRPIEARRDSTWYVLRKTASRHRVVVSAAALVIVLLAGFGAAMAWQAHRLAIKSHELASALSDSNVERGRSLALAGKLPLAEDAVWPELIGAGVTRIDGPEAGFTGSPEALHAYWAMWDIFQRSSCVATLRTHGSAIELLHFDEGGNRLCALDRNATLNSWSVATWNALPNNTLIAAVDRARFRSALAPNGNIALLGGGLLRIIEPNTGAVEAQLDDPGNQVITATFSPDGANLMTLGRDNRLRVRDAQSLQPVVTIENAPCVCRPAVSPDGRLVASALPEGALGVWNAVSGALERTLRPPDSLDFHVYGYVANEIAFGPDGTIAALVGPHLVVWPSDGKPPIDVGLNEMIPTTLAFLPGSGGRKVVASGSEQGNDDGLTIVWDISTGERSATFGGGRTTTALATSSDGRMIATSDQLGTVRVYEVTKDPHVRVLHSGGWGRSIAALSPDGSVVALTMVPQGQTGRDLLLVDLRSGATMSRFHRDDAQPCDLEFAIDGQSLFEGETSGRITQLAIPSGAVLREFSTSAPAAPDAASDQSTPVGAPADDGLDFNQIRLSPDGSVLARARADGRIDLWDTASGRWLDCLDTGTSGFTVADFSPDGRTLAARTTDACVLWDLQTRTISRSIPAEGNAGTIPVRFSRDGAIIASGVHGCIRFFDAATGRVLAKNRVPGTCGLGMAFHPNGQILFTPSLNRSIALLDTRTGRELLSLKKHSAFIISLLVTPDGNTLISSDWSGTVLAWDLGYYTERIQRELEYQLAHRSPP